MKIIIDIIKGIIIGIANVIPGVSGGTLAVAMGIYEKLIFAVNNIMKKPKEAIKLVWPYVIGIAIGIMISISGVTFLMEQEPIATSMLFVGLILGALPMLIGEVKISKFQVRDYILFVIMVGTILLLPMLGASTVKSLEFSFSNIILLFGLGIIAAATMIIPGVSGSMILMAVGYYTIIMSTISSVIKSVFALDIIGAWNQAIILIPMIIGIVLGIIGMAKLIEYLLKKCRTTMYWGIIGLIVTSPFPIIYQLDIAHITLGEIFASIIMLGVGMAVSIFFARKEGGKENVKK